MNIQDKPDYKVFASEARGGEVTDFPNLERGWGETIDKTEKIPPMEWFNLVGKRADEWLLYLTQRGIAEWDAKVKYPQYAMCQLGGRFYISLVENENRNPVNSQSVWVDLAKYLGVDGKLDESKVVQTTGQSNTSVMSQKSSTDSFQGKGFSFSKSESDERYQRKGINAKWRKIGDFNGASAVAEISLSESILGKNVFIQRTSDQAYNGFLVPPIPNIRIGVSMGRQGYWDFIVSSNGLKLKMVDSSYGSATGVYIYD